jgi:geranylgeranyl diphosphate synthase, type II
MEQELWKQRAFCTRSMLIAAYRQGMGSMQQVEPRLQAAILDVISNPGSLGRAVVAYHMGQEMGLSLESARRLACGIEFLHTASLIFDDLPMMDDARLRRGMPCIHITHSEPVAMLAALALINRAYTLIWSVAAKARTAEKFRQAAEMIDDSLGLHGLIGGQALDVKGWRQQQSVDEVTEVAKQKTSSLLRMSLVLPAIIGNGTPREVQMLGHLGTIRGLSYQAVDDLKDVMMAENDSGKSNERDLLMGRPSIVAAEGFQQALQRLRKLLRIGDQIQASLPGSASRWSSLRLLRVTLPMTAKVVKHAV